MPPELHRELLSRYSSLTRRNRRPPLIGRRGRDDAAARLRGLLHLFCRVRRSFLDEPVEMVQVRLTTLPTSCVVARRRISLALLRFQRCCRCTVTRSNPRLRQQSYFSNAMRSSCCSWRPLSRAPNASGCSMSTASRHEYPLPLLHYARLRHDRFSAGRASAHFDHFAFVHSGAWMDRTSCADWPVITRSASFPCLRPTMAIRREMSGHV